MSIPTHDPSLADPTRRRFIAAALALTAGGLLPQALLAGAAPGATGTAAEFTTVLADPAAAGRLGRAYLDDHPAEADAGTLVRWLDLALAARDGAAASSRADLTAALAALVQDEYVSAPVVRVDGWLLAPSEARLYALAALANDSKAPQ
jgi:hypothetical protein